jgi:hypothetical protein
MNLSTTQNPASASAATVSKAPDGRLDALGRNKYRVTLLYLARRWQRRFWRLVQKDPQLYGIVIVLYTLRARMRFQRLIWGSFLDGRHGPYDIVLGHAYEEDKTGDLVPCKRTYARMSDIEKFYATFSKATLLEDWIFLQGWEAGERFGLGNSGTPKTGADSIDQSQ